MKKEKKEYFRQTYTQLIDEADNFFVKTKGSLTEKYEWVDLSPSMPIFFNSKLHYTVTITAGIFV